MGRAARGLPQPWMRSEKTVWACFRTGVRFPSPPPKSIQGGALWWGCTGFDGVSEGKQATRQAIDVNEANL